MARSQEKTNDEESITGGQSKLVSLGVNFPFGEFSKTHSPGLNLGFSYSKNRFGQAVQTDNKFDYLADAGISWYSGKKEKTELAYTYDYPHFFYIDLKAGVIYNPCRNGNLRLSLGPALGIYSGDTRFLINSTLQGSYYIGKSIAISPGLNLLKEAGSDALLAATFQVSYSF